jgi:DNA topoisomerase-1
MTAKKKPAPKAKPKSEAKPPARRGKPLLIVESPTKARTITRLLGERYTVLSSKGHVMDLPKSSLGVDLEKNFEPHYIKIRGKEDVIRELKAAAAKAREIYLGSDPDREGEAIAWSIAQAVDGNAARRVRFNEITVRGLEQAFANTSGLDLHMVDSQKARRVLDRLVGYLASPLLWRVFSSGNLSAGRVQSVALRLLCEREREILAFQPEEYWLVDVDLRKERKGGREEGSEGNLRFTARLMKCEGEDCRIPNQAEAERIRQNLEHKETRFSIAEVRATERRRAPNPPFITSTLQQEAARNLRYTGRRTMSLAQQLFEGINLGAETVGLITYPRTDAFRVNQDMIDAARNRIGAQFGPEYVPEKSRFFKERKGSQGAHEAIRPTSVDRTPESVKTVLNPDQWRLYDLIYRRFLASQMADARYAAATVIVNAECGIRTAPRYLFQANSVRQVFPGFERVYGEPDKEKVLPELTPGEPVSLEKVKPEQHFTQPPPRYSEAALIKKLEVNGIGRPSTYATIVSTLDDRDYVRRKEGKLWPTELGLKVNDLLIPRFGNVFEVGFTRQMEKELDQVEVGKEEWQSVVRRFYEPFREDLTRAEKEFEEFCPKCGKTVVMKRGRFGSFPACSGYPECDYVKREEAKMSEEKCPECGKPLVEREGRFGKFLGCSGYPECKYIKRGATPGAGEPPKPIDGKCPECGKPLVEKEGRFGKFVGCSGYPQCRYIQKKERAAPTVLEEKCPECGKPLVERTGRYGKFISCSGYPACKYRPPKKPKH